MITIKINNNLEDFKGITLTNNCNGCIFEELYIYNEYNHESDILGDEYICTRCKLTEKDTGNKKPDDCPIVSITKE